jgi:dipeptidyl aminopeptidase/acylaminoacyl peptidase
MVSPKPFRGSDLRRQVRITGFDLAPDGAHAVYARQTIERDRYRSRLWRVSTSGGGPEQLTNADASDSRPRISPDGGQVVFLSDRSDKAQAWVMPLDGGEPRMIEGFRDGVTAAEWAPDGRRLAVLAPSGERRFSVGDPDDMIARRVTTPFWRLDGVGVMDQLASLWIVDASRSARPKRITKPDRGVGAPAWSPDGRAIAIVATQPDGTIEGELPQPLVVSVTDGKVRSLPRFAGGTHALAWSPGGRLAAIAEPRPFRDAWQNSGLFLLERGSWRQLGEGLDRPIGNKNYGDLYTAGLLGAQEPIWLDDDHILAPVSDRGRVPLTSFGLDGSIESLTEGEIVVFEHRVASGRIVVAATMGARPPELYESTGGRGRRLTSDGSRWFAPFRREPERVSTFTRRGSIDAWLLRGGPGRRPTVLQIHGGPHAMHAGTPWLDMVAVASAGFHVVYANPSGSLGYGEALAARLHGDWGHPDTRELIRLLEGLAADGIIDIDRVGAMGASYGGFLVNWLAGHHPDRFRALVSEQPVTDHVAEWGGSDYPYEIAEAAIGEHRIPQRVEALVGASPYRALHRAKAAVLLLHADGDLRCPPVNTDIAFAVLHRAGVPVEMVRYPDEPHGLKTNGRPDRRADRIDRVVAWFRRHL